MAVSWPMPSPGADFLPAFTDAVNRRDFVVPAYPAAALRLRRLMATENYSVAQVSEVISADPALAAAVLHLANSPLYRPDGPPITALGRAIHRVGLRSLSTIATAAGVGAQACARGPLLDLKYAVWHRAVSCALICQKLAAAHHLDSEEAFLAGLLHGFGRTVAAACLEAFLTTHPSPQQLSAEQWFAIADQHRAHLARAVAERWELPPELAAAIGASDAETPLKRLLAIADDFARSLEQNLADGEASYAAQDQRLLRELRPVLPGAIAALVEAPAGNRPPPPSAVAKPVTALKGEVRALDLGVADARSKSAAPLHANAISADGLRLDSKYPFQESTLAHLNLQRADSLLNLWVSVVLCAPQPNGFRVEVQLFSPSRELRGEWASLFEACPKA